MSERNTFLEEATNQTDTPKQPVDFYYLEAMRYLSCSDHHSDDSDPEHTCNCRRFRKEDENSNNDDKDRGSSHGSLGSSDGDICGGRERSWSHSMSEDFEFGTISQLPNLEGKIVGGRLKNRRYSDGMLIKPDMKLAIGNGHVQWADDCKKELTRTRPRKKYVRNPTLNQTPVKSILKHASEESLTVNEYSDSD